MENSLYLEDKENFSEQVTYMLITEGLKETSR